MTQDQIQKHLRNAANLFRRASEKSGSQRAAETRDDVAIKAFRAWQQVRPSLPAQHRTVSACDQLIGRRDVGVENLTITACKQRAAAVEAILESDALHISAPPSVPVPPAKPGTISVHIALSWHTVARIGDTSLEECSLCGAVVALDLGETASDPYSGQNQHQKWHDALAGVQP